MQPLVEGRKVSHLLPWPSQSQCPRGAVEGAGAESLRDGPRRDTEAEGALVQDGEGEEH